VSEGSEVVADLLASRARVVAAADEARRRLQRDVHDGAQQRLVHTVIALKLARDALTPGSLPRRLVEEALRNAELAGRELRDVVHGILPAALARGGLPAGIEALLDSVALPVDVRVDAPRLNPGVERTAYFVVAEALTNVVKHANASRAAVLIHVDTHADIDADIDADIQADGAALVVEVRDDGVGGADPAPGSGLTGLRDRVEAGQGRFAVTSPAGRGTVVRAVLPLAT
jgi:signal transduction histidine kinase